MRDKYKAWVVWGLSLVMIVGVIYGQVSQSKVIGQNYRYSLILASSEGEVEYVSFDPVEEQVTIIPWPQKLAIVSRSVGSYKVGKLYKLGSYEGKSGEFVRQKVQGFMKTPIMDYIEIEGKLGGLSKNLALVEWYGKKISQISRLDALILWWRSWQYDKKTISLQNLIRAGVLVEDEKGLSYQQGRLQQFLGKHIFDWGVEQEGLSVAVINNSEVVGLATDIASFFENAGLNIVAVRSGNRVQDNTQVVISNELDKARVERAKKMLEDWFDWQEVSLGDTTEYRSEIVVKLGKEAEKLF